MDPEILRSAGSGYVYALAVLGDKGGAAGTFASTVDIFNVSALHGPRDPFPEAAGKWICYALALLGDKGLAAGTNANAVHPFNISVLELHIP